MIGAIIAAHGNLSAAYAQFLNKMFGSLDKVSLISNEGLSAEELEKKIWEEIARLEAKEIIIFVDLASGSCGSAAYRLKDKSPNIKIVCSFNLPTLIKFFTYRNKLGLDALIKEIINAGREEIKVL